MVSCKSVGCSVSGIPGPTGDDLLACVTEQVSPIFRSLLLAYIVQHHQVLRYIMTDKMVGYLSRESRLTMAPLWKSAAYMEVGSEALTQWFCLLVAIIVWHPMGTLGIVKAEH